MIRKLVLALLLFSTYQYTTAQQREWIQRGNFVDGNLYDAVSFVIGDYAYVGTGDNGTSTQTDFYRYDPADDSWTAITDFPGPKRSGAVAFVLDGKGYIGTGKSGSTLYEDFYRYDPGTDQWTQIADFGGGVRRDAVAFTANGKAYVGTGRSSNTFSSVTSDLWEYDPIADTWTQKSNIPHARRGAVAFSSETLGYIGCGYGASNFTGTLYEYNPGTDSFRRANSFASSYSREDGVAFMVDSKAYIGLGLSKKDFVIYDPSTDNVETASMATDQTEDEFDPTGPTRRDGAVAFVIQGKAFVGMGSNGSFKSDLWSFQLPAPNAPEALTISASTQTAATLTWSDVSDNETGFDIERSEDNSTSFTALATIAANVTTYADNTLQSGKTYYYRVRATGAVASSTFSNQATVSTDAVPDAPEALTISAFTLTEANLQWADRSDNETGFEIERSTGDNTSFSLLATVVAGITTYQDASLSADQVYYYRVRATGLAGNSSYTNVTTVDTRSAPDNLTATAQNTNEVALSWDDNSSSETGFVIERSADGVTFSTLTTVAAGVVSYTDTPVAAGTDYRYRVYAVVDGVNTSASGTVTAGFLLAPSGLSVTSATSSQVRITWNYEGSNASHYVIERKTGEGGYAQIASVETSEGKTYSDATVEEAQQYTYRIKTTDATRNSGFSAEVQAVTKLKNPGTLTATVQESTVSLSWVDASQQETHYVILRFLTDGSDLVTLDTVVANTTSFEDTTIPASGDYRYRVFAIGNTVNSSSTESNTVTVSVTAETTEEESGESTEEGGEEEATTEGEEEEGSEETTEEETTGEEGGEETTEEEEVITGTDDLPQEEIVKIYPNPTYDQLSVQVGSERFAYIAVFNSQGRLVSEIQQAEQEASATVGLNLQRFPAGIYTLRIYTARGLFVRKVAKQ